MISNFVGRVDNTFLFVITISVVFFLGLTAAMIYFVVHYHHRKHPKGENIHGSLPLELLWTVIPTILVLIIFYYGMVGYREMQSIPKDAFPVKVYGAMWKWTFEYENGLITDTLYVPAGKPVVLHLESRDVIHSFYIPAFRIKQDAVPGVPTKMWFTANEPGSYQVLCAEYCGDRHSYMLSEVRAMPQQEFDTWYASASKELPAPAPVAQAKKPAGEEKKAGEETGEGDPERGKRIVQGKGACTACHSLDGSRLVGPSFKGLFGRKETVLVDGKEQEVVVDEAYVIESIKNPSAKVVKGYQPLMPPQQLTDQEIRDVIAYLKTLK
ncbi:MAG: cytochrome c oxidase subunit II [Calditrichaeota bacterium]|nr:MAG: cytochrome c oxidase subunit II [Calditrichota bacterium]